MYSIGKLAKISNVSVRTLRYYDEIGLLLPTKRNDSGHRFYADEDISKLHHILTLRDLGFPLETIQQVLSNHEFDLTNILQMRLKMIQVEQANLKEMETSIHSLLSLIEMEQSTDWKSVFATLHTFPSSKFVMKELWTKYFSKEEQHILNKFPYLGDGSEQAEQWVNLIKDVRSNIRENPKSPIAQQLAKRWALLVDDMYEGNTKLAQKVWKINKNQEQNLGFYQFDQEIIAFIEQAIQYYYEVKDELHEENNHT